MHISQDINICISNRSKQIAGYFCVSWGVLQEILNTFCHHQQEEASLRPNPSPSHIPSCIAAAVFSPPQFLMAFNSSLIAVRVVLWVVTHPCCLLWAEVRGVTPKIIFLENPKLLISMPSVFHYLKHRWKWEQTSSSATVWTSVRAQQSTVKHHWDRC